MPPVNRNKPVRARTSESEYTLMDFMREFPDDAACLDWLWRNRYSVDGVHAHCPKCNERTAFARYETSQQRQSWTCTACGKHLHPTAGTIFAKSSTSLHLWFYAMYLMTSTRCGISAKQLERELGVTYKTAWRMAHLIRHQLMTQGSEPFQGEAGIEVDETFLGGKKRMRAGEKAGSRDHKIPVLGMAQRAGRVVCMPVASVQRATLYPHIEERVLPKSTIYTDEARTYDTLKERGYRHRRCNHTEKVYVSGDAHTNTLEGFWSLVKRGIGGVYHAVSAKHLQGYLNEYAWRFNERDNPRAKFLTLLFRSAHD